MRVYPTSEEEEEGDRVRVKVFTNSHQVQALRQTPHTRPLPLEGCSTKTPFDRRGSADGFEEGLDKDSWGAKGDILSSLLSGNYPFSFLAGID